MKAGYCKMGQLDKTPKIFVGVVGARAKFEDWIANRGGVQVWDNVNLSDPGKGPMFTPALQKVEHQRVPMEKPHWSVTRGEVITDINRFAFVKAWKEVKRFHVAIRPGSQGMSFKLTDASSRRVWKVADQNPGARYRFDYNTQECVFEMPEME
jgi:hypothetical protein